MSADKSDQYSGAIQSVIAQMRLQGIQTRSDFKNQSNDCGCSACCKSKKEKSGSESEKKKMISEHDGLPLLDEIAVTVIARIVVNKIKEVCVPKRGNCRRCADRYCLCRRDIEDDTIVHVDSVSNQRVTVKIAERVREKLLEDGSAYVLRKIPNYEQSLVNVRVVPVKQPRTNFISKLIYPNVIKPLGVNDDSINYRFCAT